MVYGFVLSGKVYNINLPLMGNLFTNRASPNLIKLVAKHETINHKP